MPVADLCTDQCRGAPGDIKLVLEKSDVQKMLSLLPQAMHEWAGITLAVVSLFVCFFFAYQGADRATPAEV